MLNAQEILTNLLKYPSLTPNDAGCFDYLESILKPLGFKIWRQSFSEPQTETVENFYAHIGHNEPHLLFAGHVDVVPTNDESLWRHPPFAAVIEQDILYGRGAVDMKGGIAAFIAALQSYLQNDTLKGSISLALTADEEGPALNGTVKLLDYCTKKGQKWQGALVGEPTSKVKLGDCIKIGRRGSLSGILEISGQQGHVAYPQQCNNPLPALIEILKILIQEKLDQGTENFQASNLEITSIDTDNLATNVIPQSAQAKFNIRYNTCWNDNKLKTHLKSKIDDILSHYNEEQKSKAPIKANIIWQKAPIEAFLTQNTELTKAMQKAISTELKFDPEISTTGGTSDARFIKNYCPVIEFGPCSTTMHQIDEAIPLKELDQLSQIYYRFLQNYFAYTQK